MEGRTGAYIRRHIGDGIRLLAALVSVFGIYFLFSAPSSLPRSFETELTEQFNQPRSDEAPTEPTYNLASLPNIQSGQKLEFGTGQENSALISGWSVPETGGVWSLGKNAAIGFIVHCEPNMCRADDATLLFEGMAFVPVGHVHQRVDVWAGKRMVDSLILSNATAKFAVTLEGAEIKDGIPIILSLTFPDAVAPEKVTNSNDPREIAFRIASLQLEL